MRHCIIAIDGPAGAGKSTIARLTAKKLGFLYIDTGAIYRALTLKALEQGLDIQNRRGLIELAKKTEIALENKEDGTIIVVLDGRDVSSDIRKPGITRFVSDVAKIPGVRKEMVILQRRLGRMSSCVLDGRDIGTVVFPNATKKFFLDAQLKERINRRYKELVSGGQKVTKKSVAEDIKKRDVIDSTRKCAPLRRAKDAVYIDTTKMTIEEVVDRVLREIET